MSKSLYWLSLSSILYLVSASIGTFVAFQQNLTANFGGLLQSKDILSDFLIINGTALSPPLPFLIIQLVFTMLALKKGKSVMVGVIGLVVMGAIYTPAQLGEPILLKQFTPSNINYTQMIILAANLIFSIFMLIFGITEWVSRKGGKKTQQVV